MAEAAIGGSQEAVVLARLSDEVTSQPQMLLRSFEGFSLQVGCMERAINLFLGSDSVQRKH